MERELLPQERRQRRQKSRRNLLLLSNLLLFIGTVLMVGALLFLLIHLDRAPEWVHICIPFVIAGAGLSFAASFIRRKID